MKRIKSLFLLTLALAAIFLPVTRVNAQVAGEYVWRVNDATIFTPNAFLQLNWEIAFYSHNSSALSASGKSSGSYDETYSAIFFKTAGALYSVKIIVAWKEARNQTVVLTVQGNGRTFINEPRQIWHSKLTLIAERITTEAWPEYPSAREIAAAGEEAEKTRWDTARTIDEERWTWQYAFDILSVVFQALIMVAVIIALPRRRRSGIAETAKETFGGRR